MKQIITFKSGKRALGDSQALILPEAISSIAERQDVDNATDNEWKQLEHNPHDDHLIQLIQKRRKHTIQKA